MKKNEVLLWLVENLTEWPETISPIGVPPGGGWGWRRDAKGSVVLSVHTYTNPGLVIEECEWASVKAQIAATQEAAEALREQTVTEWTRQLAERFFLEHKDVNALEAIDLAEEFYIEWEGRQ